MGCPEKLGQKNERIMPELKRTVSAQMKIKIIRKIDELGRVVIPKDVSKTLNIYPGDNVEITTENNTVILRKVKCEQ